MAGRISRAVAARAWFVVAVLALCVGTASVAWADKPAPTPPPTNSGVSALVAPANDDFASGTAISTSAGCVAGDTTGATTETDEPGVFISDPSSVWYTWTAPSTADATFNLWHLGASDNSLAYYTGDTVSTLTEGGISYEDGQAETVTISPANIGDVFHIRVASRAGYEGTFKLEWGDNCPAPGNDDFADATVLTTGLTGSLNAQNVNKATLETNEVGIYGDDTTDSSSVWYSWTPSSSGPVSFRTVLGSLWDTTLGVYTGTSPAAADLQQIGENDDSTGLASQVNFDAEAGTQYMIRVSGYGNAMGQFDLQWGDYVAPEVTVSLHSGQATLTKNSPVHFDVAFTEPVTGFDSSDIDPGGTATTGTVSVTDDPAYVSGGVGDGMHYLVDVDVSADGTVQVTVPADAAEDGASNGNNLSNTSSTVTYDTTPPQVSLGTRAQGSKVTLTFSATDANQIGTAQCWIDGQTPVSCTTGWVKDGLTKGAHTAHVDLLDLAGNTGSASVGFTIKSGHFKA